MHPTNEGLLTLATHDNTLVERKKLWRMGYRIAENVGGRKKIAEFGELMANCQSFLLQIYRIFNIRILFLGHSPKFSSPNNSEFANVFTRQRFPLYGIS